MDNSSSSLSDDDRSDSWSIIDESLPDDGIDFEIVKDLFENNEQGSTSSEICDVDEENFIPTVTTFPNKENCEENILTNTPNNEEETNILIDFTPSTSSLRQRHVEKEKVPEFDVEKNDPKEKCTKRKRRFYKCPFIAGVSLGTLLTVCGLSLILKSSDEIISCPENKNVTAAANLDNTLTSVLEDQSLWSPILEEERLIRKYCPNKYNRDFLKNKNLRTKLLKRIDRRIKQQVRGYDVKALNGKTEKQKQKNELIGLLNKERCIQRNNEKESNSKSSISKQKCNDAFIFQAVCPVKAADTNCVKTSNDEKEPCKENNLDSKLNQNKALIVQPQQNENNKSIFSTNDIKNKKASNNFLQQEQSFHELKHNIISHNYKALQEENNKQADIVTTLENRINTIKEENLRLSSIIEEQEKLVDSIQSKIKHKKRLFEKRDTLQQNLQKHLKIIQDRKFLTAKRSLSKIDDETLPELSAKMSDKLLDEMLLVTIKNTEPESDREAEYLGNNLERKGYGTIEKKNEYEQKIPLMKRRDVVKLQKSLNVLLEEQKLIAEKARKMGDEEHVKQNNRLEKCDPQKTWIRKRNELY